MKTRFFSILSLVLIIGLTQVSAQNGTIYHSYPTKVNDGYGVFLVTCDGVNVDLIEIQWDGMDILHMSKKGPSGLMELTHWKFTSAATGEEFRAKESFKANITFDPEGNTSTLDGTDHAILIGNKGSRYKLTTIYHFTPTSLTWEFVDIRCF